MTDDTLTRLRDIEKAASPAPWQWLESAHDGDENDGDELQDGHGEMVATGFREDIVFDGKRLNRDGTLAAIARNTFPETLALVEAAEKWRTHQVEGCACKNLTASAVTAALDAWLAKAEAGRTES